MRTKKTKLEPKPLPEGLVLGTNVRYYNNGWKTGLLDKWEDGLALITPIGGYGAGVKRHIKVSEANIEPLETIGGS